MFCLIVVIFVNNCDVIIFCRKMLSCVYYVYNDCALNLSAYQLNKSAPDNLVCHWDKNTLGWMTPIMDRSYKWNLTPFYYLRANIPFADELNLFKHKVFKEQTTLQHALTAVTFKMKFALFVVINQLITSRVLKIESVVGCLESC